MSTYRFYLSVPTDNDNHGEFVEITDDVLANSIGNLKENLASNEYDVGTIKFNKISINLRNEKARFSEANNPLSMFGFKRDTTILKIVFDINAEGLACGSFACGQTFLSAPVTVYKGLLEDNSSKFDADSQIQTFNFLGTESVIGKEQVNFSALSVADDVETTIFNILNQPKITRYFSVLQTNISVNLNFTPDSIASLEDVNCLKALNELLFLAGAVLYVKDDELIVSSRDAGALSAFTFYGAASDLGIENIHDVSSYTLGLNRTFNFWKWRGTILKQKFDDSIEKFGFRSKEIDSDLITNNTTRTQILNALLTEFGFPKIELDITVEMTTPIVEDIYLLDKINIDLPSDYRGTEDGSLPAIYGTAVYGEQNYITATSSLVIDVATNWKILNRSMNIKKDKLTFKVREV